MKCTTIRGYCSGRVGASLLLGVLLVALPLAAGTGQIYVANNAGTTFDVIDIETNKVVKVIENFEAPESARFSPDGSRVYLTQADVHALSVMDRKSGKVIKSVPLSGWPNDIGATSDGRLVVVCIRNTDTSADQANGMLDIIDATSLEKVKSIPVKGGLHDVEVTRDSKYAVAGSPSGHLLTVFDLQSMEIAWQVQYDQGAQTLAIESNPDGSGRRIFLQLANFPGFTVVDFAQHKEVARIKVPDEPTGFGKASYHGIGIPPDNKTVWVNSRNANSIFVYSLPEIKLLGRVALPESNLPGTDRTSGPAWITFSPDSKTAYESNAYARSVTAIDVKTMKVVADIPVGEYPHRITTLQLP